MEDKESISEEESERINNELKISEEKLYKINENFRKTEEEGAKGILKHFDRIHDKLFTFNNILIAGYFALTKFNENISSFNILIPIANLCLLIYIEYRMMEKSRFESKITQKPLEEIEKWNKSINKINLYSLLTIGTTLIVTIVFLVFLLFN